jgi:addiction module RelE/StbE family toxin
MAELHYSPEAANDLAEIKDYISTDLASPVAANNTVAKIAKSIRNLETFPEIGARLSSIIRIETDYRFLVCGNYLAFYRVQDGDVYIDRILYGRRDYVAILFGDLTIDDE